MGIRIAVHDNEEGKKAVNLLSKASHGQYRRWARHHGIQAKREKTLNKKGETQLHEKDISMASASASMTKNRSQNIVEIVEILGFGVPKGLRQIDTIGRALGVAGFKVTIRPLALEDWVEVDAKVTSGHAQILLKISLQRKMIVFHDIFGADYEPEKLMKGMASILTSSPHDYYLVPNYEILSPENYNFLRKLQTRTPRKWATTEAAHTLLFALDRNMARGGAAAHRLGVQGQGQGPPTSASAPHQQANPNHAMPPKPPPSSSFDIDDEGTITIPKGNIRNVTSSSSPLHNGQPRTPGEGWQGPRRGFSRPEEPNYGNLFGQNLGYDPWGTAAQTGPHFTDSRAERPQSGGMPGYGGYDQTGSSSSSFPGSASRGSRPPTFTSPKETTIKVEPEVQYRPGAADPEYVEPNPEDSGARERRIPDSERAHRHLSGQPWGQQHPAVLKVANALQGLGPIHVTNRGKHGIFIGTADGSTTLGMSLAGRSPRTGFRMGTLVFYQANVHTLHAFFNLIPRIAFKDTHPSVALPIIWKNDFRPLVNYVSIHAPEQLADLARVLAVLPKGNKLTGNINRNARTTKGQKKG